MKLRLRNLTYGVTIHYDVEVEFTIMDDEQLHPIHNKY